jgi:hypothetical protein
MLAAVRARVRDLQLPAAAREQRRKDHRDLLGNDPGATAAIQEGLGWLCRAQDFSKYLDGGVARHFSLLDGWSASYPETTGYIVPTMIVAARTYGRSEYRDRARRMLDWLVSIQLADGSFQGGLVDSKPVVGVTFNTGQILIGLAAGVTEFGHAYRKPMERAAEWLVRIQDADGCWRKGATPFAAPGVKAYETHVAWGLYEAARTGDYPEYSRAATANVHWALRSQQRNGWMENCCLTEPTRPLTHTLGYVLRGLIESYRFTADEQVLAACVRTADGLLDSMNSSGFLPGRLTSDWQPGANWSCLTGAVQIAACWFLLYEITGDSRYRDAARTANSYVRRTLDVTGPDSVRGGVKGSHPIDGDYGTWQYLNWACKFMVDANMLEVASTRKAGDRA